MGFGSGHPFSVCCTEQGVGTLWQQCGSGPSESCSACSSVSKEVSPPLHQSLHCVQKTCDSAMIPGKLRAGNVLEIGPGRGLPALALSWQ